MTPEKFRRLVDNMKRDGVCTSSLYVYREDLESEDYEVLSGNHRRDAAIEAGLDWVPVIEVLTRIPKERRVAAQLSHNAIFGEDDLSILKQLYDPLPLDEKLYSGLSDDKFKLPELDLAALSVGGPTYEEMTLLFLPEEVETFRAKLADIEKRKTAAPILAARYADFDTFFTAVCRVKSERGIINTALAVGLLADLALERLDQLAQEGPPAEVDIAADRLTHA